MTEENSRDSTTDSTTPVRRVEWRDGKSSHAADLVVCEEPLEIRVGGVAIAVVMRTPGHDEELVRGFLLTEQIVRSPAEVASVRHCSQVDDPRAEDNVMQVRLSEGVAVDLAKLRRNMFTTSSCGICGKASIEQALAVVAPISCSLQLRAKHLYGMPDTLRSAQTVFDKTGGLHAAGLFTSSGESLVVREDIGRHNAVDKVVGWRSQAKQPIPEDQILVVSGRVSFEIVQKALAARISAIVAVSAPSSLAVQLAQDGGVALVGFARGKRLCVYAGFDRILA